MEMNMGIRHLAEAVIIQSLEDLWDPHHKDESREFFAGEGFRIYGDIAELNTIKKYKLLHYAGGRKYAKTDGIHGA